MNRWCEGARSCFKLFAKQCHPNESPLRQNNIFALCKMCKLMKPKQQLKPAKGLDRQFLTSFFQFLYNSFCRVLNSAKGLYDHFLKTCLLLQFFQMLYTYNLWGFSELLQSWSTFCRKWLFCLKLCLFQDEYKQGTVIGITQPPPREGA